MHLREVEMNAELKHTLVKWTQNVLPNVSLSIELIRTLIQDIEKDSKIEPGIVSCSACTEINLRRKY